MSADPTHDWQDRVDQAEQRLDEVEEILRTFINSNPYGVVTEINPHGKQATLTARMTEEQAVPRRASVVLAEVFGHLRSSLDHLMCAICVTAAGGSDAPAGTQFPIFKDQPLFRALDKKGDPKRGSGRWQMRGAPSRVQAIVQRLQPYKRGSNAPTDPLWLIHDFAVVDKHRKPHIAGAILQGASAGIREMWGVNLYVAHIGVHTGAFKKGTEVTRMTFTITDPSNYRVNMDHNLTYDVAFDPKGPGAGGLVIPTVRPLIAHLRDIVFPQLEPFV